SLCPLMEQHEMPIKKKSALRDFLEALIIALAIALPVKYFLISPFIVVGTSMYPTFLDKDYLIIDKLVYTFKEPERGDVVVFRPPYSDSTYFIKRVIGLPGEEVIVKDGVVTIVKNPKTPNEERIVLNEPYVSSMRESSNDVTLGVDEYYVLGDNRSVSSDSRVWGPLPKNRISGRVDLRLFPIKEIGFMPGKAEAQ
ncbi:MAG: signal peptidase I, partial [Candidatus Paceibacterota bacterium]